MTGFLFSDRWRTLHTNVLQAGVTDTACQCIKLLRVTTSAQWLKIRCEDLKGTFWGDLWGTVEFIVYMHQVAAHPLDQERSLKWSLGGLHSFSWCENIWAMLCLQRDDLQFALSHISLSVLTLKYTFTVQCALPNNNSGLQFKVELSQHYIPSSLGSLCSYCLLIFRQQAVKFPVTRSSHCFISSGW